MLVFLNGRFVPENEAVISVFDRGFLYSDGLFETMRVSRGKPFQWKEHLARFERGAAFLKIQIPFTEPELHAHALELIARNRMPESVLRLNLSRGIGKRGYSTKGSNRPTIVMTLHPAPEDHGRPAPFRLIISSVRLPAESPLAQFKTCNKLPQIMARAEADARDADEALLGNECGEIVEGSASNLFWVRDGVIFTPPRDSSILPGITRATVLEICNQLGLKTQEKSTRPEELLDSAGIFLTLSSRGIVEAGFLDAHELRRAPLVHRIRDVYEDAVVSYCK